MQESNRQKKFARVIQKEIGDILQREITVEGAQMLTVTVVRSTPDLRIARVYISVFPDKAGEAAVEALREDVKHIRHLLAQRIRQQVRHIPELQFYLDDTAREVEHMDQLFDQLHQEDGD